MHTILTFRRHNVERIANYYVRDLYYLYSGFGDLFDIIDLRDVAHTDISHYEVILIDNRCLSVALRERKFDLKKFENRLAHSKGAKVLLAGDLHNWSFFNGQHSEHNAVALPDVRADLDGYGKLLTFVQNTGVQFLVSLYACPELDEIKKLCNLRDTYVLDNHIDTKIFRDFGQNKIYDVLIYGSADPKFYSFRARIRDLIFDSDFNYLRQQHDFSRRNFLPTKDLAKLINQSWLCLATVSNFDYLVEKYFEIAACNSVVLGDMNDQGKQIWGNNFVELNRGMSDKAILKTIKKSLEDKKRLQSMASTMRKKVISNYSMPQCKNELFSICESIAERVFQPRMPPERTVNVSFNRGYYAIKSLAKRFLTKD